MRRINSGLYPSGGYIFREEDGTLLKATSWKTLYRRIEDHRRANGKPLGSPEEEAMAQACLRNPNICFDDAAAAAAPIQSGKTTQAAKAAGFRWLAEQSAREDLQYVSDGVARSRASTCAACPKAQLLGKGCNSCKVAISGWASKIRKRRPELNEAGFCTVLNHHNATAAWLETPAERNDALPGHCWRKAQ